MLSKAVAIRGRGQAGCTPCRAQEDWDAGYLGVSWLDAYVKPIFRLRNRKERGSHLPRKAVHGCQTAKAGLASCKAAPQNEHLKSRFCE